MSRTVISQPDTTIYVKTKFNLSCRVIVFGRWYSVHSDGYTMYVDDMKTGELVYKGPNLDWIMKIHSSEECQT